MPTILRFVDKSVVGIVLTVDSIVTWLYLCDVGLGNGLKNRFTEAVASNDDKRAQALVSTAYFTLSIIVLVILAIVLFASSFIDWNKALNINYDVREVRLAIQFIMVTALVSFVLRLINTLIQAVQKTYLNEFIGLLSKALKLISIFIAIKLTAPSLLKFVLIDHSVPLIILVFFSVYLFYTQFRSFRPTYRHFKKTEIKNITSLGFRFFGLQIAAMVLFNTDNFIIARLFSSSDVTVYAVIRQYYGQVWLLYSFISVPLWSAYTKAIAKQEFDWIKRITIKVLKISLLFSVIILLMFLFQKPVVRFWLSGKIMVPTVLSFFMALSQIIMLITSPFVNFINGSGKLRISIWIASSMAILNIPLCIFLARTMGMGPAGVICATCFCNGIAMVFSIIQYYKLVYTDASGIWIK